jgi:hypothetical protein
VYQKPWSATHFGLIRLRSGEEGDWAEATKFVEVVTNRVRVAVARRVASFIEILLIRSGETGSDSLEYLSSLGQAMGIVN